MATTPLALLDRMRALQLLVVGEAMLDSYLEGGVDRLCREAPVPIVTLARRRDVPGGAANAAANAAALGARVRFLSASGDDPEGAALRAALQACGVPSDGVLADRTRRTIVKHRIVADGQLLLRYDQGTTEALQHAAEQRLLRELTDAWEGCDAVVVSDYEYGVLTPRLAEGIAALQRRRMRLLVVDARSPQRYARTGVTAVKPNYGEAVRALGQAEARSEAARVEQIARAGPALLGLLGADLVAVTLDRQGALLFERGRPPYRTYARPAAHGRATGAGDTFTAALALALAAAADGPGAVELASAAASAVVEREGTTVCAADDLRRRLGGGKEVAASELEGLARRHRDAGRRIVFTNGCFDILHRGHVAYLNAAKALGDVLVVAVNGDRSVRRLKGEGRPINPLEDRLQVLAALSCVDHLVAFEEETPVALIRAVRPDVYVKGGDYTRARLPEAPVVEALGGEVRLLPFVEDRSTSAIIARIRGHGAPLAGPAGGGSGG